MIKGATITFRHSNHYTIAICYCHDIFRLLNNGGSGDDLLDGGLGYDRLTGGAGRDVFRFESNYLYETGGDVITDYEEGLDVVDLRDFGFASRDEIPMTTSGGDTVIDLSQHHGGTIEIADAQEITIWL